LRKFAAQKLRPERKIKRKIRSRACGVGLPLFVIPPPTFAPAHNRLGWAYLRSGKYEQAVVEFQKARALSESDPDFLVDLGYAYAVGGNRDEAQKILAELKRKREHGLVSSSSLAIVYGALDEEDNAFAWLEKSDEERDPQLTYLKVGPRFDPLRQDPRFATLVTQIGFPK
jgi:tetratricopeptide (TPR) repeat protein